MNIAIIGTGYVGLVTGTCFSEMGNEVWCVDVDQTKLDQLQQGILPIYEQGLEEMVKENVRKDRLHFTTNLTEALAHSNLCFIAVGTPMTEDGSADLQYVLGVAKEIGGTMTHPMVIVDKSTVPVGTADKVKETVQAQLGRRGSDLTFEVVSNPEFLKEGNAVADCMHPDRIVIGSEHPVAIALMKELYTPYLADPEQFIVMDVKSAEMTKYTANAILAAKISFMNEIAAICERVGADVNQVREGIGSDPRIGPHFIYPGCGYGGSCFPKDVQALIKTAEDVSYSPSLLKSVETVNEAQKMLLFSKIMGHFKGDIKKKTFAIWGLSFKPETDDMRFSPAIPLIEQLIAEGATVQVYDPKAMEAAKSFYFKDSPHITYCQGKYEAVEGAEALVLVTEWQTFRHPDVEEIKSKLKNPVIFDGRNQYIHKELPQKGFSYYPIGVGKKST